jgi:hypothetical protein
MSKDLTPRQKKERVAVLQARVDKLANNPDVLKWHDWVALKPYEQEEIKQLWADYYVKTRTTRAYARFQEIKEAFKSGQMKRVKELAAEAREALNSGKKELVEPPFPDPDFLRKNTNVDTYIRAQQELRSLQIDPVGESPWD